MCRDGGVKQIKAGLVTAISQFVVQEAIYRGNVRLRSGRLKVHQQVLMIFLKPRTGDAISVSFRTCSTWHARRVSGDLLSINPFDDDNGSFFVLVNEEEQHSLWPAFVDVPAGWRVAYGAADRAACLNNIEQQWADIRPKSLRERVAQGRTVDQ